MCTLSWLPLPDGFVLAMNRDELRTRAPGLPPRLHRVAGLELLCPGDPDGGGTWLAVNAAGHAIALLNRYEDAPHDPGPRLVSRGLLVQSLAGLPDRLALGQALERAELTAYRPFTLASLEPGHPARLYEWTGRALTLRDAPEPGLLRVSSGTDQAGAERARGRVFRDAAATAGGLSAELLDRLHRSHLPERSALSVCMHRVEASTVSFSLVTVGAAQISFRQVEGPPCEGGPVRTLALARSA